MNISKMPISKVRIQYRYQYIDIGTISTIFSIYRTTSNMNTIIHLLLSHTKCTYTLFCTICWYTICWLKSNVSRTCSMCRMDFLNTVYPQILSSKSVSHSWHMPIPRSIHQNFCKIWSCKTGCTVFVQISFNAIFGLFVLFDHFHYFGYYWAICTISWLFVLLGLLLIICTIVAFSILCYKSVLSGLLLSYLWAIPCKGQPDSQEYSDITKLTIITMCTFWNFWSWKQSLIFFCRIVLAAHKTHEKTCIFLHFLNHFYSSFCCVIMHK